MDLGLNGKVAMVAGGSSGLGLATARELAIEGAHVVIGARDRGRLAAAERTLKEVARGRVATASVDITDQTAARRWVEETVEGFGSLHVVVVSGAGPPMGTAAQFSTQDYQAAMGTVVFPAVSLSLAALPHLRTAGWGRLLFVASETASVPISSLALSGVTRAAIMRFAQALAAEVAPDGITVDRKSTRLNSSHSQISYAVFCLKKK